MEGSDGTFSDSYFYMVHYQDVKLYKVDATGKVIVDGDGKIDPNYVLDLKAAELFPDPNLFYPLINAVFTAKNGDITAAKKIFDDRMKQ